MYKQIILSKILEYIRLKKIAHKGTKCLNFHCPLCESVGLSANVIPNTAKICCYQCGKGSPRYFNLIDVARKVENLPNATDEEIKKIRERVKRENGHYIMWNGRVFGHHSRILPTHPIFNISPNIAKI